MLFLFSRVSSSFPLLFFFNALNGFVNFFILELFESMYIFPTVCSAVYEISFDRLLFDCVISAVTLQLQSSIFNFLSYFFQSVFSFIFHILFYYSFGLISCLLLAWLYYCYFGFYLLAYNFLLHQWSFPVYNILKSSYKLHNLRFFILVICMYSCPFTTTYWFIGYYS